jgi:hypothetical protein
MFTGMALGPELVTDREARDTDSAAVELDRAQVQVAAADSAGLAKAQEATVRAVESQSVEGAVQRQVKAVPLLADMALTVEADKAGVARLSGKDWRGRPVVEDLRFLQERRQAAKQVTLHRVLREARAEALAQGKVMEVVALPDPAARPVDGAGAHRELKLAVALPEAESVEVEALDPAPAAWPVEPVVLALAVAPEQESDPVRAREAFPISRN